jgi:hypothetical protein
MKVKFSDILDANGALGKLSQERLPVGQSVSLARLIKKLNEEMNLFNDQRERLLKQYGEYKDDAGGYEIPKGNLPTFRKDFDELINSEVETGTDKIKITLQKDSTIEAAVILGCEIFCEFEEGE